MELHREFYTFKHLFSTGIPAMTDEELDLMRSISFPDDDRVLSVRVLERKPIRLIPPSTKHLDALRNRFADSFFAREHKALGPEEYANGCGRG